MGEQHERLCPHGSDDVRATAMNGSLEHPWVVETALLCGEAHTYRDVPQGMTGTVEIEFCGEPSMSLSLMAR